MYFRKESETDSEYSKLCGLQQIYIKFEVLLVE